MSSAATIIGILMVNDLSIIVTVFDTTFKAFSTYSVVTPLQYSSRCTVIENSIKYNGTSSNRHL